MSPDSDHEGGFPVPGAGYMSSCDTVSGGGSDWSSLYRWSNRVTGLWVACAGRGLKLQQLEARAHVHSRRAGAGWAETHRWVGAGTSSADVVSGASLPPLPGGLCGSLTSSAPSTAHGCRVHSRFRSPLGRLIPPARPSCALPVPKSSPTC